MWRSAPLGSFDELGERRGIVARVLELLGDRVLALLGRARVVAVGSTLIEGITVPRLSRARR